MKTEIMKSLIKELYAMEESSEEYKDDDIHFTIDSKKDGNTLVITVNILENEDKKYFEQWVNNLDDDIFQETWTTLAKKYPDLNKKYESEDYPTVIELFTKEAEKLIKNKIIQLQNSLASI